MVKVCVDMKGMLSGSLYCTFTITRFPGLLHGEADGVHAEPVVGQVVVAVRSAETMPGKPRFFI